METGVSGLRGSTAHHTQHEFGGGDEVFIDPRQFKAGLAKPTNPPSMQVHIGSFTHYYNEWTRSPEQDSLDLTSFIPATDSRYVLIALDADTNELVYRPGPIYVSAGGFGGDALVVSGGMGAIPAPAGNEYPIAAVNLTSTTTTIDWSRLVNNIQDTRLHISPPFKHIIDRLDQLEGTTGQNINLPTTGAQTTPTDDALANAWALQGYQIATTAPTTGSYLAWDVNQNSWAPSGVPADTGEENTAVNLGTGFEVFREKSGVNLNLRTLIPGTNTTIASSTSAITITANAASGGAGEANTATNLGTGIELFREKSVFDLQFRTLVGGTDITIGSATSTVTVTNAASEHHFSFTIGASNTWNNELIPIWQAPRGNSATIVEILGTTSGTTDPTLNFNFQVRDYNAMQSAGIDVFAASQAATSATEQFTAFARAQVDPRGHLMFTTGSGAEAGSVNYLNITVYYTT
jgi:hypothetical protein